MTVVGVVLGLLKNARILKKLDLAKIVGSSYDSLIVRPASGVDVGVIYSGPNALDLPPEAAGESLPLS